MTTAEKLLASVPPHNLDAEKSVIGSVLLDPDCLDDVIGAIRSLSEFYAYAHQVIFRHLLAMHSDGKGIDITLLADRLSNSGDLDSIGGLDYLAEVINSVPTAANAAYYAQIVHDKATLRALIHASTETIRAACESGRDSGELLGITQSRFADLGDTTAGVEAKSLRDWLDVTMTEVERRTKGKTDRGLPTGIADLDLMLVGLKPERLVIIAGRPGSGKSVLGLQIAVHAAIDRREPVLFVSLEMTGNELTERLLAARTGVDGERIASGRFFSDEQRRLVEAQNELADATLFIDDQPRRSIVEIAAQARRIQRKHGLKLIVIDYLQLVEPDNPRDPRHEQVARMARRLKTLARELQIPIVCLAQLNREGEKAGSGRPKLSHLRESGSIEQDADVVILVHREEQGRPDDPDVKGLAELNVAKQRNGRTGVVKVAWKGETYQFLPLAKSQEWNSDQYAAQL